MISMRFFRSSREVLTRLPPEINIYRSEFRRFLLTTTTTTTNRLPYYRCQFVVINKRFASSEPPVTNEPKKSVSKKEQISSLNWRHATIVLIFGTAMLLFFWKVKYEKEEAVKRRRKEAVGKMAIGGPFELVDQNGKTRTSADFLGKWMLIYFGFSHCPDICPDELEKMIRAVDLVEKVDPNSSPIVPIFITVDPDRDSVDVVAKYVKDFSPKLIGLTGDKKQIEKVTKAYRVYFNQGKKDEDNDYIVDHTVIMYLVDPEGNFVDYYGQNKKAEEVATAIAIHMGTFEAGRKKNKQN